MLKRERDTKGLGQAATQNCNTLGSLPQAASNVDILLFVLCTLFSRLKNDFIFHCDGYEILQDLCNQHSLLFCGDKGEVWQFTTAVHFQKAPKAMYGHFLPKN